jgi:hypothetical protein
MGWKTGAGERVRGVASCHDWTQLRLWCASDLFHRECNGPMFAGECIAGRAFS